MKNALAEMFAKADKTLGKIVIYISFCGIGASVIILGSTILNIIMRSVFTISLNGTIEIGSDMMIPVAFCALPAVTYFGVHIKVDLLARRMPNSVQSLLRAFNLIVVTVICATTAYYVFEKCLSVKEAGTFGDALHIPFYPFYAIISIMLWLCTFCSVYNLVHLFLVKEEVDEDKAMRLDPDFSLPGVERMKERIDDK